MPTIHHIQEVPEMLWPARALCQRAFPPAGAHTGLHDDRGCVRTLGGLCLPSGRNICCLLNSREQKPGQRLRRKAFYLRAGYQETAIRCTWRGEDCQILSSGGEVRESEFWRFWEEIR